MPDPVLYKNFGYATLTERKPEQLADRHTVSVLKKPELTCFFALSFKIELKISKQ
jgi:hypothetical protein